MPGFGTIALVLFIPAFAFLGGQVQQKATLFGVGRTVTPLNNEDCYSLPELVACEHAWINEPSGLAYLGCSDRQTRANWTPASLHLHGDSLPEKSIDYMATFNFNTREIKHLTLTNTPSGFPGLYTHGFDAYPKANTPGTFVFFIINHLPPANRSLASTEGADSVIEVFEGVIGESSLKYIKTIRNEFTRTPNSVAAASDSTFYFTNDHRYRHHWTRAYELYYSVKSDIIFCDASGSGANCKVAADDLVYPNGIARSTGGEIYSASSVTGKVLHWEAKSDHTLSKIDEVYVPNFLDNLHAASNGEIFIATFPKIFEFVGAGTNFSATASVEAWKVTNDTDSINGSKIKAVKVFADTGSVASGVTSAAPYKDQVLLTGILANKVVICNLK